MTLISRLCIGALHRVWRVLQNKILKKKEREKEEDPNIKIFKISVFLKDFIYFKERERESTSSGRSRLPTEQAA